jgi:hypothetical protein
LEDEMMRAALTIFAGAVFAACAVAQSQSTPPATQTPAPNAAMQASPAANALPDGSAINAELNGTVDSKKAKVGDKVEARTTEAFKNGDTVLIPKGTKLLGHVTAASARSKGDKDSTLAIQFDQAVPKKEQAVPLTGLLIVAAAPPVNYTANSGAPGSDAMANTGAGSQSSPMGPGHQQQPQAPPTANAPQGSGGDMSAQGALGPLPANSRGVMGINGLQLMMQDGSGGRETVFTSTGKDVHLDGGTRLLLVAKPAAPAASGQ